MQASAIPCASMLTWAFFCGVLSSPVAVGAEPQRPAPVARQSEGWYEWAFLLDEPKLAELDLSFLLDAPAGKHGFLTVKNDGHFYFQDGTRARFFGTNVGGANCSPDKAVADIVAARLAAFGVNLLRLHTPDTRWRGIIDYDKKDSRHLSAEALDRYDYFVAQLKNRGIYVYFDLLDYRNFQPADGVRDANRMGTRWEDSCKGASIFDRRMIELQKEFATQLLTHRNPYTGLRYVDEPALAMQEITNENSLFYLQNQKLMLPSYVDDLRGLWNQWLVRRYGGRSELSKAWTDARGQCALLPQEDPAGSSVLFPTQHLFADLRGAPYRGERSPARLNALTRFLYEQELAYYDEMKSHLRGLGLKCPITGTNQDFSDASNLANARCDFIARNNYWQHPNVNAKPMQFNNVPMIGSDIVNSATLIANVASSAVVGQPLVSPEFNCPWPNEFHSECLPMMASYGRLQDWDGLLFFAYDMTGQGRHALSSFGTQSDPVHWGQIPLAALIFLRGDIAVAKNTIHIGASATDCFSTRRQRTADGYSPFRVLPYLSKVRNAHFDKRYEGDAEMVVSSGHSSAGDYSQARHALVFADWPFPDEAAKEPDRAFSARQTCPGLRTEPGGDDFDTQLVRDSVPRGGRLIERGGAAVGFYDDRFCIFPCASADSSQDPAWLHRLYLRMANHWKLPGAGPVEQAGTVFRSDTGELVLDRGRRVFTAVSPKAAVATGYLAAAGELALGRIMISCKTPFASISLVSLDSRPIEQSQRLLLTAVARAENTGQAITALGRQGAAASQSIDADTGGVLRTGQHALTSAGRPPVLVEPVDAQVRLITAANLQGFALGPRGEKMSGLAVNRQGDMLAIDTRGAQSPWILLSCE